MLSAGPRAVHVSGAPLVAWLTALALTRHGLAGTVAAARSVAAGSAPLLLGRQAQTLLGNWDLLADLPGAADQPDRLRVVPAQLLEQCLRRVDAFGLFAAGQRAAAVHVVLGARQPAELHLSDAPAVTLAQLGFNAWRLAAALRGWLAPAVVDARSQVDEQLAAVTLSHAGGALNIQTLFDVRLVVLARVAESARWQPAVQQLAPHVPLDLVTLGAGGRFEADAADLDSLLGTGPDGTCLVAPAGEVLQRWSRRPADVPGALRQALLQAGVLPGVLR